MLQIPLPIKLVFVCLLFLAACARQPAQAPVQPAGSAPVPETEQNPAGPQVADCPQLYVLAPENYIVDVAAGANVILDPARHEFLLYCSPEAAANELARLGGQWRIYTLDGPREELARQEGGKLVLAQPAKLDGWLER